ncbi:thiol reductase thioredoxin [Bacteroidales bacterium]|nr:thiol reductase thioredoxin [Bacteroidales bacterium]
MKKITLFLAVISLFLVACNNSSSQSENSETAEGKEAQSSKVIHLTKAEFLEKVVSYETDFDEWEYLGDKPCILDFYADWCPPCKKIAPILDALSNEYDGQIYIYKIDTDEEGELAAAFGIKSIPTLYFIPMKGNPTLSEGELTKSELKKRIEAIL